MQRSAFTDLVGNEALKDRLKENILGGRLTHAYLLEAPRGGGKHTLALRIAMALACESKQTEGASLPCMRCPSCKKILEGNSPDILYIGREDKATLGVEQIRRLRADLSIAPNELENKVYIIEDAHLMTVQAQNALLLTLEEPPPYVLFLLLCESVEPLLETIRSRAQTLRLRPIPTEEMRRHLLSTSREARELEASAPEELCELLAAADGSIGQALSLLDAKRRKPILNQRKLAREFLALCAERHQGLATMRFSKALPEKREELSAQLRVMQLALRDLLLLKESENAPLCFFFDREEAMTLAYRFTVLELLKLSERTDTCLEELSRNANVRLALMRLFADIGLLTLAT